MRPAAPVLFSTTNGCPSALVSPAATARAPASIGPPALYATMILTGLSGYSCAAALETAAKSAHSTRRRRRGRVHAAAATRTGAGDSGEYMLSLQNNMDWFRRSFA